MKKNLLILLFALFTQFTFAQDFWTELEIPEGIAINSIATDSKGWLYLGTNSGIFCSKDLGENFQFIGPDNSQKKYILIPMMNCSPEEMKTSITLTPLVKNGC